MSSIFKGFAVESNVNKLHELSLRIDQIQSAGEWLARALVHTDASASQTGSLISVLADDVRGKLIELVSQLETEALILRKANMQ